MFRVEIPQSQRRPLKALLQLKAAARTAVLDSLESAGPSLVANRAALADAADLPAADAEAALHMLLSLYYAHHRDILGPVSLVETLSEDDELGPRIEDPDELRAFFERLFTLESSLGILSKAYRLSDEHANLFCVADVVSDLRPVFDNVENRPAAATIVHTLRLAYHGERGELKELFVGLRPDDIGRFASVLDRAQKKHQSLAGYAQNINLPLLTLGEDE